MAKKPSINSSVIVHAIALLGYAFATIIGMLFGGIIGMSLGAVKGPEVLGNLFTGGKKGEIESKTLQVEEEDIL